MESTIYNILKRNKSAAIALYKRSVEINGLYCIIKEPVDNGSIFGLEDARE